MADAMTAAARDDRIYRFYTAFIDLLIEFLKNPAEDTLQKAIKASRSVAADRISGAYWGNGSFLKSEVEVEERLKKLVAGDEDAWLATLAMVAGEKMRLADLKALSPFKDFIFILVNYGDGFVALEGAIKSLVSSFIGEGMGWQTYRGVKYAVALPKPDFERV